MVYFILCFRRCKYCFRKINTSKPELFVHPALEQEIRYCVVEGLDPVVINPPEKSDTESLPEQMNQHDSSSDEELVPKKRVHSEMYTTISNSDTEWLTNQRIHKHFKSNVYTSKLGRQDKCQR